MESIFVNNPALEEGTASFGRSGSSNFASTNSNNHIYFFGSFAMSFNVLPFPRIQYEDSRFASIGLAELNIANEELRLEEDVRSETHVAGIVGQSSALREVLRLVEVVAA